MAMQVRRLDNHEIGLQHPRANRLIPLHSVYHSIFNIILLVLP